MVVPVYNRPEEIRELLQSLSKQTYKDFEVIIVEDGSDVSSEEVVRSFQDSLNIKYFVKENEGQGFARNFGFKKANGNYYVIFDSDCIIPPDYFELVHKQLQEGEIDAYGGPDKAHESFSIVQKAINQTMTSFFTTGGTRGGKLQVAEYHPRSFNMGLKKEVFAKTGGYIIPFMGEDIEWTIRIIKHGFKTSLIPEAFVYHKRRTNLRKFFKQLKYFGRARINISRFHKRQIKLVHLFPSVFLIGSIVSLIWGVFHWIGMVLIGLYAMYLSMIMLESLFTTKSIKVALLTPFVAIIQLYGYGWGMIYEYLRKLRGINPNTAYTELY